MTWEEALVSRLAAASLSAGDRVSWFGRQRGDALPAIVLTKVSVVRDWTHEGPDGLDDVRVQFDLYGRDDAQLLTLARALRDTMEAPATVGGVVFHEARLEDEDWTNEGEQEGGQPLLRIRQDYTFYHEET